MRVDRRSLLDCALLLVLWLGFTTCASAGGGPENVLLVVNANSAASKEIANHYVRLRNLPASNVLYLDYEGDRERIKGEAFREQILKPILTTIQSRGLAMQIDIIAYASDFPWRVDFRSDFPEGTKLSAQHKPSASLTGATYLWQFLLTKSPGSISLDSNWYVPEPSGKNAVRCRKLESMPSRAFRARYAWQKGGIRSKDPKGGRRYFLSTMLGVTSGRGNTAEEVIESLRRSVYAETSPPSGWFYYAKNSGIRSTTRHGCYPAAVNALRQLGAKGVIVNGNTPPGAKDIAGMMLGAAKLDLAGLVIQPGAICEHLTSYGGDLRKGASHTPLTDLIRAGASGVSGTICEPLALQAKFPLPSLHVHYRRGSSLAEAFYQSVAAPYQLLIVGDPLCQPWARRPGIEIEGWPDGTGPDGMEPVTEGLTITPRVLLRADNKATPFWELFVDGRLRMRLPSGASFGLQLAGLGPGWHELRCVGMDPGALEFQGRMLGSLIKTRLAKQPVRLSATEQITPLEGQVELRASAPGAERLEIRQNWRVVGKIEGDQGTVKINASLLGRGPVKLQVVAKPEGAASVPIQLVIQ